ncbi:ribosome maturation factor RimP [Rhodospirillum rubrum]|uniref:Ribosome maturation factor RimP n=1 Tax=Rhodospirillum rubrum (strain ATCC 11170 / ATH 1.1.1 / DSM 467 / LMG 4362 / NCIMB 8255 / S1) TaxID=269796 RepID=RIMP_RHORT|nr:ribosome maturation factor RimP [Rhodospirillum rubrum]Q2RMS3.1 RecName: Full=Ribosome maturation factor RimP [Rhodospirillum rubrum ATCC 11170]ABC24572.1 Protein of unknown function DUF150 [Rhodospirillum rubrum ATCC 11170]MBK5956304.1 ribosome maturation factor [Rhodospirillum rubrum]QXG80486.1 ribosome maturation factor RimP [Rhodospirillum rubrum]HAQ01112.1 ribosome maturation factor [Rhodospirillum rubrum]HCF17272.1 ribosome maturation factor RimP [Rhodospirillum rubrum]
MALWGWRGVGRRPTFFVFASLAPIGRDFLRRNGDDARMMGHLEKLLAPTLDAMGYEVVRVTLLGSQNPTLQVMAERLDGVAMTVSDCETISRALGALLDVEDPIAGRYSLEISSPGIDRPLTRPKDYARFAGHEARIETDRLIEGHRRMKGLLLGIDEDRTVRLRLIEGKAAEDGTLPEVEIPFGAIVKAKLLLTDALIAKALKDAEALADEGEAAGGAVEGGVA